MGFWEVLGKVVSSALERGAKAHLEMQKKAAAQLKDYEKKIINAEKSGKMSNPEYAKKVYEAKQKLETARVKIYTGKDSSSDTVKINADGQVVITDMMRFPGGSASSMARQVSGYNIIVDDLSGMIRNHGYDYFD